MKMVNKYLLIGFFNPIENNFKNKKLSVFQLRNIPIIYRISFLITNSLNFVTDNSQPLNHKPNINICHYPHPTAFMLENKIENIQL